MVRRRVRPLVGPQKTVSASTRKDDWVLGGQLKGNSLHTRASVSVLLQVPYVTVLSAFLGFTDSHRFAHLVPDNQFPSTTVSPVRRSVLGAVGDALSVCDSSLTFRVFCVPH